MIIPENILNPGNNFLDYEIPWLVPESIEFLNKFLKKTDNVLELGSGGSTIFFLKKCSNVITIETDEDFLNSLLVKISEKMLRNNLQYILSKNTNQIKSHIESLDKKISVSLIDSARGINRTSLLDSVIKVHKPDIIILDNWSTKKLFSKIYHFSKNDLLELYDLHDYDCVDFFYDGWFGSGTRILISKKRLEEGN